MIFQIYERAIFLFLRPGNGLIRIEKKETPVSLTEIVIVCLELILHTTMKQTKNITANTI